MKSKTLLIFCLSMLLLSVATVSIQAWGIPDDVWDALLACNEHCEGYYDEKYPQVYWACMDGCTYKAGIPN